MPECWNFRVGFRFLTQYIVKILPLIIVMCIPIWFSVETSRALQEWDMVWLNSYTAQIVSLGTLIESYPKSPLGDRIILQRKAILDRVRSVYGIVIFGYNPPPSLDISSKYHFFLQKYKLSCEAAATRMVIESLTGISTTEDDIIASWRHMPEPYSSWWVWWDPDIGFVGSLTGSQFMRTGYGIYEQPIAKYLTWRGFRVDISNDRDENQNTPYMRLSKNIDALEAWSRVILWGDWCTTSRYDDGRVNSVDTFIALKFLLSAKNPCDRPVEQRKFSWKTETGKVISGLSGEHVFLLLGYIWTRQDPSHIVVWDTDTGRHIFPYDEWMRKWKLLQYRSLIISLE